jgi:AraC-like DNA-binding protein
MINTILSFLFLFAIGQGLFLSAALLSARQAELRSANRLLSALLLACVAIIGHAWLGIHALYTAYPHSALAIATLGLLAGPLLYLYLRSMLFNRPLGRRALLHLLPFCIATLAMLPFYLQPAATKLAWMLQRQGAPWYLVAAAPAKLAFFLAYIVACFRLVRRAQASPLAAGLALLMKIWLAGGILSVAALAIEFMGAGLPLSADVVGGLSLMCFVYATALLALRVPLSYRPQAEPSRPRYANSLLSDADRSRFLAALTGWMESEHPYRDGELTLEQLAGQVAMTPHELSQLLNDACGANFQEYLNRYRVAALQLALHDPRHVADSILELALASGFNSKSALNRVFKKHAGMTPSQFRAQQPSSTA